MKTTRRSFVKGLASLALLPSLAWARMDKLEAPEVETPKPVATEPVDYRTYPMDEAQRFFYSINSPSMPMIR